MISTKEFKHCPDYNCLIWKTAEEDGLGDYYQYGVGDGILQKFRRINADQPLNLSIFPEPDELFSS